MEILEIYFSEHDERSEYEAVSKGYRTDVYVKVGEEIFNLSIYTITRLTQDFDTEVAWKGLYTPDVNIVLVENTDCDSIINIVEECYKQMYFQGIKPCDIDIHDLVKIN